MYIYIPPPPPAPNPTRGRMNPPPHPPPDMKTVHLLIQTPEGSAFTLIGPPPRDDGPNHVLLTNAAGKVLFRLPKEWVTRSTEAETAARIAEDAKRRKADASRN